MKRPLRMLLIAAPLFLLLLGVPAGVALARRAPQELPPVVQPRPLVTPVANGAPRPLGPNGPQLGPPLPIVRAQNGVSGTVTRVGPELLVVYTKAKKLAFVRVNAKTTIRMNGKNIKFAVIQRGDQVTILGGRDREGGFVANAIRVVRPEPPIPANGAPH